MAKVNIGSVWDRATEFLADNLGTIAPVAASFILVPLAIQGLLQPLVTPGAMTPQSLLVQIASFVLSLVSIWGQLQIAALALAPEGGIAAARSHASRSLLMVFVVNLVLAMAFVLLIVPVPIGMALLGADLSGLMAAMQQAQQPVTLPPVPPAAGLFALIYSLVLALFALWVAARLALLNIAILAERAGFGGLRRSFDLTRGNSWALIGLLILFGIVSGVAVLAARALFGSLLAIVLGGSGPFSVAGITSVLAVAAVSAAFSTLAGAFLAKLYLACRARETSDA